MIFLHTTARKAIFKKDEEYELETKEISNLPNLPFNGKYDVATRKNVLFYALEQKKF